MTVVKIKDKDKEYIDKNGIEMISTGGRFLEKSLGFATVNMIVDRFVLLNDLISENLNDAILKEFSDIEKQKELIQEKIEAYLKRF